MSEYAGQSSVGQIEKKGIVPQFDPTFYNWRDLLSMLEQKCIPLGIWNRNQIGKAVNGF